MWARIENNTVAELTDIDPTGRFNPALIWVPCPTGTSLGDAYDSQAKSFGPPPAPSVATLDALGRMARDSAINGVWWRIQRYESQKNLGVATTETSTTYQSLLQYVEDLRNWPTTSGFPDTSTMPVAP